MRTTVTLNDELLAKARRFTGIQETSALLQQALRLMVERGSPTTGPIGRLIAQPQTNSSQTIQARA